MPAVRWPDGGGGLYRTPASGCDRDDSARAPTCSRPKQVSVPVDGLWQESAPRAPPDPNDLGHDLDSDLVDQTPELTYVDIDTFLATF